MRLIGLPDAEEIDWFRKDDVFAWETTGGHHWLLRGYLEKWDQLRKEKNYKEADALKQKLEATGLQLSVSPVGPEAKVLDNFDPSKLEGLQ